MAKNKIQRIDQEIAKVREKIEEYQDKLKTLEAQKTEAENLEIVQMVRALRLTPEQLNAMLSGGTVPGMAAASANYNEQEDTDHEELENFQNPFGPLRRPGADDGPFRDCLCPGNGAAPGRGCHQR